MNQSSADRLYEINRALIGLYTEQAECRKAEAQAFDAGYFDGGGTSDAASKRIGRHNALPFYLEGLTIGAKITALQEERDYLRFVIGQGYG